MKGQLNMTKSMGGDVFVPMVSVNLCRWLRSGSLPMIRKKNLKVADWLVEVSQFVTGGWFYVFLSYLNRFVYGFGLIWNSSSSRVCVAL